MSVPSLHKLWPHFDRGATVVITSNFLDGFNHAAQPANGAQVNFSYTRQSDNTTQSTLIPMTQNSDGSWTAVWDSRGAAAGNVYWSVETPGSPPVSVEDGQFVLDANAANQPTF